MTERSNSGFRFQRVRKRCEPYIRAVANNTPEHQTEKTLVLVGETFSARYSGRK